MRISENGKKLIKSYEGVRLTAYKPVPTEKYWTIGYGHYGADVKQGMRISQARANQLFDNDIPKYEKPVQALNMDLTQKQFDALVSFCYNCGETNLKVLCSSKDLYKIATTIILYNKGGGVILPGLVKRRTEEQSWIMSGLKNPPLKEKNTSTTLQVDGYWGMDTTKQLQKVLGVTVDGYIGGQVHNVITKGIVGIVYNNGNGSDTVRALQKVLNVTVDGYLGVDTIRSLQRYLGTPVDGVLSRPSTVVKALQHCLNDGKL